MEGVGALGSSSIYRNDVSEIYDCLGRRLESLGGAVLVISGGAGFLPSYLAHVLALANDRLLSPACSLICIDNFATGLPERLSDLAMRSDFRFLDHDISKPVSIEGPADYIVHAASIASPPVYRKFPLETIDVNVSGTRNMLNLAREKGSRSFVYLSSSEIYGDPAPACIPTSETYRGNVSCIGPRACYDESKRMAETLCMTYHRIYGTPVKIARPFNVYGPSLRLDDGRVIPDFLRDALRGEPITLFGDGEFTRSFCYISDAVVLLFRLLLSNADGQIFNVGNDEEISIRHLAEKMRSLFVPQPGIRIGKSGDSDYTADNPRRRCPDITKARSVFSWEPRISLDEGLRRTVRHYLEKRASQ